jgi:hypothetical protein
VSDDPEPTDYEIYTFNSGTAVRGDCAGASGIDFNYGAAPDLQLTANVLMGFDSPASGESAFGLSNVELAAKYRFLHQDSFGLDVSVFPRVFLQVRRMASATMSPRCFYRYGRRKTGVADGPPLAEAAASSASAPCRTVA